MEKENQKLQMPEAREEQLKILREKFPPYTKEQMEELGKKNLFYSPFESFKKCNGMHFEVLTEIYEGKEREDFGTESSTAWFNNEGEACTRRIFRIRLENGEVIEAELEELDGYYIRTNQVNK